MTAQNDSLKTLAAREAARLVEDGMIIGIGTGSTAECFIHELNARVRRGLSITGVPTSLRTRDLCVELGIKLTTLDDVPELDLTIDGADEIDPALNVIKGGGGALLREKIVAYASKRLVIIADESKVVSMLGAFPLPIEVNRFGLKATFGAIERMINDLGMSAELQLRQKNGTTFATDGAHFIIDASFGRIHDPLNLSSKLLNIPGVVQHGLFMDMAEQALIATANGVKVLSKGN